MSDINTTDPNDTANAETSRPRNISDLLPLVTRQLKAFGVAKVYVHYEGEVFDLIFGITESQSLSQLAAIMLSTQIKPALKAILRRRYPDALATEGNSGFFEWDLAANTLHHEHITTHHGI